MPDLKENGLLIHTNDDMGDIEIQKTGKDFGCVSFSHIRQDISKHYNNFVYYSESISKGFEGSVGTGVIIDNKKEFTVLCSYQIDGFTLIRSIFGCGNFDMGMWKTATKIL